jgi:hypothetical protein
VYGLLDALPAPTSADAATQTAAWRRWQHGLPQPITLPKTLPPLRMLLLWDNLTGHYTPELVLWLIAHGIMPLYTPLGGLLAEHGRVRPTHYRAPGPG